MHSAAAAAVFVSLVVVGCGMDEGAGRGGFGVEGLTVVDVGCPTLPAGATCPVRPIAASISARRVGSPEDVATATSDTRGRFHLTLPPGRYVLVAHADELLPSSRNLRRVAAVDAGYAHVTFRFDSGVRTPHTR